MYLEEVVCPNPKCKDTGCVQTLNEEGNDVTYYCQNCQLIFTLDYELMDLFAHGKHNCKNCEYGDTVKGICTLLKDEPEDIGDGTADHDNSCFTPIAGWPLEAL